MIENQDIDDILEDFSLARMKTYDLERFEICRALLPLQMTLYEHLEEAKLFAAKYGGDKGISEYASPRLLSWLGIKHF